MEERTRRTSQAEILVDQQTVTGGVRTYGTHVRRLDEGESLGGGAYRFLLETPYEDPRTVAGVLTCTVAEWFIPDPSTAVRVGCYIRRLSFGVRTAIVDVTVKVENATVVAVNIEGRIVDKRNLTL